MAQLGYKQNDLVATTQLVQEYNEKLKEAIQLENYAEACSTLRAIQDECNYALRVAACLSLESHLHNDQRR